MCYYLLLAENRNSQLVVTPCASHQQCHKPTLRSHLSLMGFHLLRSMSATLVAFLMVMCCCSAYTADPVDSAASAKWLNLLLLRRL